MSESSNRPRRTLVLTGAIRGIGHATMVRFFSAGWRVIACSHHPFPKECPWDAGPEDHIQVDLGSPEDALRAVAEIRKRLEGGQLHALVNHSTISLGEAGGSCIGTMDTELDIWTPIFQVNFFAPIVLTRGLIEELKKVKGRIVNVTSIAGSSVHPQAGAAYATAKAALTALTREMASDCDRVGVRVNAIAPSGIDTHILSPCAGKAPNEETPMQRLGTPGDVAKSIHALCSEASYHVNGTDIIGALDI